MVLKRKSKGLVIAGSFLISMSLFSGGYFVYDYTSQTKGRNDNVALADKVANGIKNYPPVNFEDRSRNDGNQGGSPDKQLTQGVDFNYLKSINNNATRWIYLPGTNLNQVVMQEPNVGEYFYERHSMYGGYRLEGELFTPAIPEGSTTGQLLVFGHYMHAVYGDYMFAKLQTWYRNPETANKYKYIYVYEKGKAYRYRVYSAKATVETDTVYSVPRPLGTSLYQEYVDKLKTEADWTVGEAPDVNTPTLVLSTCNGPINSEFRYYVSFVLDEVYDNV